MFFQGNIDGFRATQMIQVKAQPAGKTHCTRFARGAGPGMPFSRAATLDCIIWEAPFGRAVKQSLAALHLLTRTGPKLAPRAERVQWVLSASCALRSTASRLAEPVNITLKEHYTTSNKPAAPIPPPTHMETTTYFAARRLPSSKICPVRRAPVIPYG